jgi:hypothetical protein
MYGSMLPKLPDVCCFYRKSITNIRPYCKEYPNSYWSSECSNGQVIGEQWHVSFEHLWSCVTILRTKFKPVGKICAMCGHYVIDWRRYDVWGLHEFAPEGCTFVVNFIRSDWFITGHIQYIHSFSCRRINQTRWLYTKHQTLKYWVTLAWVGIH